MFRRAENRIDDGLALRSQTKVFAGQKSHEFLFGGRFAGTGHRQTIFLKTAMFKEQSGGRA
jgi:hypothetical protein